MARRTTLPRMTTVRRLLRGLALAALLPGALYGLWGATETGLLVRPHEALPGIAVFTAILFYFVFPIMVIFGLPLIWLLRRFAQETWWAFTLGGALVAVLWAALMLQPSEMAAHRSALEFALRVAVPGGLTGLAFWFLGYLPGSPAPRAHRRRA